MSKKLKERLKRLENANKLLDKFKELGNFFEDNGRLERDNRGRIWYTNDREHRVCISNQGKWWRTNIGGTEQKIIKSLVQDYVKNGECIPDKLLGPWPDWYSGGDPWGYGSENAETIRKTAVSLGIRQEDGE